MPRVVDYPLNEVQPGQEYVISRVNTHDAQMLEYFDTLAIRPGQRFRLVEQAPFNGPLKLEMGGTVHFIGHELSRVLRVCSEEEYALV